jgi:hypothetical protein
LLFDTRSRLQSNLRLARNEMAAWYAPCCLITVNVASFINVQMI